MPGPRGVPGLGDAWLGVHGPWGCMVPGVPGPGGCLVGGCMVLGGGCMVPGGGAWSWRVPGFREVHCLGGVHGVGGVSGPGGGLVETHPPRRLLLHPTGMHSCFLFFLDGHHTLL